MPVLKKNKRKKKVNCLSNCNRVLYIMWIIISHWTLCNLQGKCGTECKWQMFLMVDLNLRPNPTVWHLGNVPRVSKKKYFRLLEQCVMFESEAGAWNMDNPHVLGTTWRNHFGATKKDHWFHSRRVILNPFCSNLLLHSSFISHFTPGRRQKPPKKPPLTSVGEIHHFIRVILLFYGSNKGRSSLRCHVLPTTMCKRAATELCSQKELWRDEKIFRYP